MLKTRGSHRDEIFGTSTVMATRCSTRSTGQKFVRVIGSTPTNRVGARYTNGSFLRIRKAKRRASRLAASPIYNIYFLAVISCASNTSTSVPPFPLLPPAMTSGTSFMPLAAKARATSMVA